MSHTNRSLVAALVLVPSILLAPAAQADPEDWGPNGGPRIGNDTTSEVSQQPSPVTTVDDSSFGTTEIVLGSVAGILIIGGAAGVVARRRHHPVAHHPA